MKTPLRIQYGLLVLLLALAGCDSNQGTATDSTGNTSGDMSTMDHSQTTSGSGMGGMADMNHEQHMQHMAGMGDMTHEQHMQHMRAMGGMGPMGGAGHTDHDQHMHGAPVAATSGSSGLDYAEISTKGYYIASVNSELEPIALNQIHSWTLHLENASGGPVDNAQISVDGGMPAHNHGLPTQPEVTENLGNGDYLVEGLMFQMPGRWQVSFEITVNNTTDTATFDFVLE